MFSIKASENVVYFIYRCSLPFHECRVDIFTGKTFVMNKLLHDATKLTKLRKSNYILFPFTLVKWVGLGLCTTYMHQF